MAFDKHGNLVKVTVTVAPSPTTSGTTLSISNTDATALTTAGLTAPFNMVAQPTSSATEINVEIIRVTDIGAADSGGTGNTQLTITRTAETQPGSARNILVGDYLTNNITTKVFTDMESAITYNSAIRPPQGYVVNGKIVTSVSSNNLTVALKTLAGNDPSTTDPVYIRIGNTVYSVTAALSNTLNAGTNWFNSGATETATYEIDYFVYLGYNATDGVVIGFARVPYGTTYADFNTTTTNDKYCAISTTTHAVSTDIYENIGRFNAILSAGAGYTWSIPATSIIINRPINYTRNLSYLPQMTISSPMTLVSTASPVGNYQIIGNTINVSGQILQAKSGTAATYNVYISAPMNMNISLNTPYGFANIDNMFGSVGLYGGGNNPFNLYQFRSASNMSADSVQRFADWGAVGTPLV